MENININARRATRIHTHQYWHHTYRPIVSCRNILQHSGGESGNQICSEFNSLCPQIPIILAYRLVACRSCLLTVYAIPSAYMSGHLSWQMFSYGIVRHACISFSAHFTLRCLTYHFIYNGCYRCSWCRFLPSIRWQMISSPPLSPSLTQKLVCFYPRVVHISVTHYHDTAPTVCMCFAGHQNVGICTEVSITRSSTVNLAFLYPPPQHYLTRLNMCARFRCTIEYISHTITTRDKTREFDSIVLQREEKWKPSSICTHNHVSMIIIYLICT